VGDSVGTINGFMEWDDPVEVSPTLWHVRLRMRDLATLWGPVVSPPESATVDVTPRRLQKFQVVSGRLYTWQVTRSSDGAIVQSDSAYADPMGVLTIPGVKVYRQGSELDVQRSLVALGVGPARPPLVLAIAPLPCPLRSRSALAIAWPRAGDAAVDLLDAAGRRIRSLLRGRVESGWENGVLDPAGLPAGIYFVRARQAGASVVRRIAILR
jgi:hypothetical protein